MTKRIIISSCLLLTNGLSLAQDYKYQIHAGMGIMSPQQYRSPQNNIHFNPHMGVEYIHSVNENWSLALGLKYNYKNFVGIQESRHKFYRDGRQITQTINTTEQFKIHLTGIPIRVRYHFDYIKYTPTLFAGINLQYGVTGMYTKEIEIRHDNTLVQRYNDALSIHSSDYHSPSRNEFTQYTQYIIGTEWYFKNNWGLIFSYQYNPKPISFLKIGPTDHVLSGMSINDRQLQLSFLHRF